MATIFLSHASRDDALAKLIVGWLNANGFDDIFVDHDSIRSGDKWTEALRRATSSCRVVLCVVTPDWLASAECFGEFVAGWYAGRRMIPLLSLAGAALDETQRVRLARVLKEDQGIDLGPMGAPAGLDLAGHPTLTAPLIEGLRAAGALAKVGLDPAVFSVNADRDAEGNLVKPPFPGLESFGDTDADAAIFYGRSSEIAQVLEDLREFRASGDRQAYAHFGRAYVIQGASGSGKSSLLKAGVLPRLRRERGWVALRSFRPGPDPLLNFAEALAKPLDGRNSARLAPGTIRDGLLEAWRAARDEARGAALRKGQGAEKRTDTLGEGDVRFLQALRRKLDGEIDPLRQQLDRPAATCLIAIDQGEELVHAEGESADALADYLRAALLPPSEGEPARYAAAITVRTDSFQEIQTSPRLENLATRPFDLRPLPVYRFAEAIEQPAARYAVEIEPQLVEMLMDDAGGKDALPLLAFTLQRLWRQYEVEKRIRKANYESVGKLLGLIEDAAERALRGMDPSGQQGPLVGRVPVSRDSTARRTFLPALAQVNERGAAIRRVATLSTFDDEEKEVLNSFERWRLITTAGTNVEVAHEALFRAWPRFVTWLEPEKVRLETLRGLESAAISWDSNGRRQDFISHSGRRLRSAAALKKHADFRQHIDSNQIVTDYLRAAADSARGWRIATGYSLFSLAVVFVGALALTLFLLKPGTYWIGLVFVLPGALISWLLSTVFVYLAAWLRQRSPYAGFRSDAIIFALVVLILGGFAWSESGSWRTTSFEVAGAGLKEKIDRDDTQGIFKTLDARTLGILTESSTATFLLPLPPVIWALLQLAWMLLGSPVIYLLGRLRRKP